MRDVQRSTASPAEAGDRPTVRSARQDRQVEGPPDSASEPLFAGAEAEAQAQTSKRGFPHPLSILLVVTVLVWVGTMFIPSGRYQLDADGRPIAGSFQQIESPLDFRGRVRDLLLSPVNGLY